MDLYNYYASFYDHIQDSVVVFNPEGDVIYCNDAFSLFSGFSILRFQNRRVNLPKAIKSFKNADFDLDQLIQRCELGGSEIVSIETKAVFRGLAQIAVSKLDNVPYDEEGEELFLLTLKDLTHEEGLMQSFKSEIGIRNKKLQEMNQLIEILQKIRLLDNPFETIREFIHYMLNSNRVCVAISYRDGKKSFIADPEDLDPGLTLDNPKIKLVQNIIDKHLSENVTSRYICLQTDVRNENGEHYAWSVVPFKFAKKEMFAIFIFENQKQKDDFSHQSAIILSEQLNLILNNLTLKEFASTDGLTKLKNSLYFREQLDALCKVREQGQLLLFDVDFFKKVNDTYGHLGGDAVLMMLGEKVTAVVKKFAPEHYGEGIIARVGGEEFAVFIPDVDATFAQGLAEAIRQEVEKTEVHYNQIIIKVTISLGIASWTSKEGYSEKKVTALYKIADEGLYHSKKSGRNQVSMLKAG